MKNPEAPIAVFDSGMGGISVLRALCALLPHENFLYFGDCANAPYGSRSTDEIRDLTMRHAEHLFARGAKALVLACNTATAAAAESLRAQHPDEIIIGIEPALKPAAISSSHPSVLVMATPLTLREDKLRHLMKRFDEQASIHLLAAPEIVRFVEHNQTDSPALSSYLKDILAPYRMTDGAPPKIPVDCVVLGCTHFPFAAGQIRSALGYAPQFFDGSAGTARETRRRLDEQNLLNPSEHPGNVELLTSGAPETKALADRLLHCTLL